MDSLLLKIPGFLIAITIHEFFHGYIAYRLGDPTARDSGRLSLNPLRHIDPVGTVIVPGFLLLSGSPFVIGWARPVPVDPRWFRDPRRGMMYSALAGPLANFGMAVLLGLLLNVFVRAAPAIPLNRAFVSDLFVLLLWAFQINVLLGAFNLLPLHPLDGSKVLTGLLPLEMAAQYHRLQAYGPMILIALIFLGSATGFSVVYRFISPFLEFFNYIFLNHL